MKKRTAPGTMDPVERARDSELAELREQARRVLRRLAPPAEYPMPAGWTPWRLSLSVYTQTRDGLIREGRLEPAVLLDWLTASERDDTAHR